MTSYYDDTLSGERLKRCYELAPPRVQAYLTAEVEHVCARLGAADRVLELGCGHGRVLRELAVVAREAVGIDTSLASLQAARGYLAGAGNVRLAAMDASAPGFRCGEFDLVCCVQNGISAFHTDERGLLGLAVELTRPGGRVLASSYADGFWEHRLEWFRIQAANGLIGPIDEAATGGGVIVCRDGFTATTVTPGRFAALARGLGRRVTIDVVNDSAVFCEILV